MTTNHHNTHLPIAQRKGALIEQAASYRSGITKSKNVVQANLHVDALARNAVQHFAARSTLVVGTLVGLNNLTKGNWRGALPLLASGVSLLAKRGAVKPLARGAAVLAAVGAGAYFLIKKTRRPASE
jgi:hypothetical protein